MSLSKKDKSLTEKINFFKAKYGDLYCSKYVSTSILKIKSSRFVDITARSRNPLLRNYRRIKFSHNSAEIGVKLKEILELRDKKIAQQEIKEKKGHKNKVLFATDEEVVNLLEEITSNYILFQNNFKELKFSKL
jgi:hypothetical protein